MANRRKDPQDKKSVPSRANSKMDSEEQEFWNLDPSNPDASPEDGDDTQPDAPLSEDGTDDAPRDDDAPDEIDHLEDFPDLEDEDEELDEDDAFDDIDDSGVTAEDDEEDDDLDYYDDDEEDDSEDEPDGDEDDEASTVSDPPPAEDQAPPRSDAGKGEKIALIVLCAVLVIGAIWGVGIFVTSLPEGGGNEDKVDFPVAGTSVTISAADTYWRKPDRTKDTGVRMDTRLMPAAVITLKEQAGTCALRFFFIDDKDEIVGDSITQSVADGKFEGNGSNQIEVYGTSGFGDPGDHAAYTTNQIDTWHLMIKEGPDHNARGADFQEIVRIPISFIRK